MRSIKKQQEWAKGQIKNPSQDWTGMCQSFSRQSYGMGGFGGSATIAWGNVSDKYKHKITKYSDKEWWSAVPEGAILYSTSGQYGHAWLAAGDSAAYSNDYKRSGQIDKCPVDLPGWSNVKKATVGYIDGCQWYDKDGSKRFGLSFDLWDGKIPPFENVMAAFQDPVLANKAVWRLTCRLNDIGFGKSNPVAYEQTWPNKNYGLWAEANDEDPDKFNESIFNDIFS